MTEALHIHSAGTVPTEPLKESSLLAACLAEWGAWMRNGAPGSRVMPDLSASISSAYTRIGEATQGGSKRRTQALRPQAYGKQTRGARREPFCAVPADETVRLVADATRSLTRPQYRALVRMYRDQEDPRQWSPQARRALGNAQRRIYEQLTLNG